MELEHTKRPWLLAVRSSERFILSVVCMALFTDMFLYSIIVPVLPEALTTRAGLAHEDVQLWTSILLAVYGGTLVIGSPILGYIADKYQSRQLPFTFGLAAIGIATVLFMISTSPMLLIIARALQGLSASAVFVVGVAMVPETIARERVAESMGFVSMSISLGGLMGPLVGGMTYEMFGFLGVFVLPIILIIIDIVLRFAVIEKQAAAKWETEPGENSPLIDREQSDEPSRNPIIVLLTSTRLPVTLLSMVLVSLLHPALETTLPLFVMDTFHWTAGGAGILFFAITVPCLAGAVFGKIVNRFGTHHPQYIAFLVEAVCWGCLRFVQRNRLFDETILVVDLCIVSMVIILIEICAMKEIFDVVEETEKHRPEVFGSQGRPTGQVYALLSAAAAASHLIGPLVAGPVKDAFGWKVMTATLAAVCVFAAVVVKSFGAPLEADDEVV